MEKALRKNINMTEGRLFGKILFFVLPLMATNILQVLYNMADTMVVSLSSEGDAVGAVGTTAAFIGFFLNLVIGLSVGVNVVVAQELGSKDYKEVERTVHASTVIGTLFGVVVGLMGIAIAKYVLTIMGNTGRLLELATTYSYIYLAGAPFIALSNIAISIFRAKGDTKTPLIVMSTCGLLNVGLNVFFVLACGLSVEGVAIATVISNLVSAVVLFYILSRENSPCKFSLKKLSFDRRAIKRVLTIGLPAAIQGALFSLSNMLIQSSVLQVNNATCPIDADFQPVVKGNAATLSLEGLIYNATNAVYQATTSFVGQNYGAQDYKRVRQSRVCCYTITVMIAVIVCIVMMFLSKPLLSLYGVNGYSTNELEIIAYQTAMLRMWYMFPFYSLLAVMEVGSGVLRGQNYSLTSTIIALLGACVFRIVWIYTVFATYPTLEIIYLSYPISWILTALAHFVTGEVLMRRDEKRLKLLKA